MFRRCITSATELVSITFLNSRAIMASGAFLARRHLWSLSNFPFRLLLSSDLSLCPSGLWSVVAVSLCHFSLLCLSRFWLFLLCSSPFLWSRLAWFCWDRVQRFGLLFLLVGLGSCSCLCLSLFGSPLLWPCLFHPCLWPGFSRWTGGNCRSPFRSCCPGLSPGLARFLAMQLGFT